MAIAYHRVAIGPLIACAIFQALAVAHSYSTEETCVQQASRQSTVNFNP